jgi:hypothetical protein
MSELIASTPIENRILAWESYVWRAAVAGMVGGLLLTAAGFAYARWQSAMPFPATLIALAVIFAPVSGALMGSAVGAIIWKISQRMNDEPGAMFRFLLGLGFVVLFSLTIDLAASRSSAPALTLGFAICFGGLPGLMARPRHPNDETVSGGNTAATTNT